MFLGEYEHSVDAKGRVAIPARFRPELESGLIITRGFERCLQVYPRAAWDTFAAQITSLPLGTMDVRKLQRLVFASAFPTEIDKQGRMLLPASLRASAQIGENVVFAGMNTFFEIWAADAWAATLDDLIEQGSDIATVMANFGS